MELPRSTVVVTELSREVMDFGPVPAPATAHFERVHARLRDMYVGIMQDAEFRASFVRAMNSFLIRSFAHQASVMMSSPICMGVVSEALEDVTVEMSLGSVSVNVPASVIERIDRAFGTSDLQLAREVHES